MSAKIIEKIIYHLYKNTIRRFLPKKRWAIYNGIKVGVAQKSFDLDFPNYKVLYEDIPLYEEALMTGLRKTVRDGDKVVVIGVGYGATVTLAAKRAGLKGEVICFDASRSAIRVAKKTAQLNKVEARISFNHAFVGEVKNMYGSGMAKVSVTADLLPECDVLELDCEGAEKEILEKLKIRPRVILVETHGCYGSPSTKLKEILEQKGYRVNDCGPAEPRIPKECEAWDLRVLEATLT